MNSYLPYNILYYNKAPLPKSYKTIETAILLLKEIILTQEKYMPFFEQLISIAPSQEEKDVITSIRNDENRHNKLLREIYKFYTNNSISIPPDMKFVLPKSYIDGLSKAKFGELKAIEQYRDIRAGLPDKYYTDIMLEILTDHLIHAHKYDYLLYLNLENINLDEQAKKLALSEFSICTNPNRLPSSYKSLEASLSIIKQAIQNQTKFEFLYNYLISVAPSEEEKNIITQIRNDEIKHNKYFTEIYQFYTNQLINCPINIQFKKPQFYVYGLIISEISELKKLEQYKDISVAIPDIYYKDMIFEIITDNIIHLGKYDYLLLINKQKSLL
ncbi:Rubrerythrin [Clostridium cavendishii DSM 21758]|uniref:Rubrerythrin n=1 Tax=Clostridium cavendishii DSM 21758 TaxID=1121302 RepID=A0A1M6NJE6_9CLOT|nr:ferritin-like domain-containing protein [Clostridium cavendishii]SHJ95672.1 Rubrerythrin [Clostridium cavendishii DSM 21758]